MRASFLALSLLACLTAAAPQPNKVHTEVKTYTTTIVSTETPKATPINLLPIVHPSVDVKNLKNLKATPDATFHYAEKQNGLSTSQQLAIISSPKTEYPLVQLENTAYIKSITCTDSSATVVFTDAKAYKAAAGDWKGHTNFIMVSYDPACGAAHDATKRDYMLVSSVALSPKDNTIHAAVKFVDISTAFGPKTEITCDIGHYKAEKPKVAARGFWDDLNPTISKDGTLPFSWSEYPTNAISVDAWGGQSGYQIYQDATTTIACITCGTDGNIEITGSFVWKLLDGVTKAAVTISGNMKATVALGVDVQVANSYPIADRIIAAAPLSPLTIADIVNVGPILSLSAGANLDLSAEGSLLVGATLAWPSLSATGDAADGSFSSDGLSPSITPITSFNGSVQATLDLHLPVSLGVGIEITAVNWKKEIALVDTPGVTVSAGASNDPSAECVGANVDANFYNNVDLNVFDFTTVSLLSYTTDLFTTCISLPASTTSEAPTTTAPANTTTAVTTTASIPLSTGVYSSGLVSGGTGGVISSTAVGWNATATHSRITGTGIVGTGYPSGAPAHSLHHGPYHGHNSTITAKPSGGPVPTGRAHTLVTKHSRMVDRV